MFLFLWHWAKLQLHLLLKRRLKMTDVAFWVWIKDEEYIMRKRQLTLNLYAVLPHRNLGYFAKHHSPSAVILSLWEVCHPDADDIDSLANALEEIGKIHSCSSPEDQDEDQSDAGHVDASSLCGPGGLTSEDSAADFTGWEQRGSYTASRQTKTSARVCVQPVKNGVPRWEARKLLSVGNAGQLLSQCWPWIYASAVRSCQGDQLYIYFHWLDLKSDCLPFF